MQSHVHYSQAGNNSLLFFLLQYFIVFYFKDTFLRRRGMWPPTDYYTSIKQRIVGQKKYKTMNSAPFKINVYVENDMKEK